MRKYIFSKALLRKPCIKLVVGSPDPNQMRSGTLTQYILVLKNSRTCCNKTECIF